MPFDSAADLLPALPWLFPFFTLPRLARRTPSLISAPPASGKLVSIVVPARNEEAVIENAVKSILTTTYRPFELLVVDDRSTDETAAIVAGMADSRVQLVRGAELPEGWYGKPWACYQGYRVSKGELLLFTDADTTHQPELLSRTVGALLQENADLVTISPHQECVTFWERLVMPQIWFLLALRYHPAAVTRARKPRDVIANGQFILTTRKAYESAGTHQAVRHEVAEDLALAQAFVRDGHKLHFAFADQLMTTRMYHGLGHLIEGWSKNLYLGGRRSFPDEPILRALVPAMLIFAMLYWLVPPTMLLAASIAPSLVPLVAAALAATVLSAVFWMLICHGMGIPVVYGLGYPLGVFMSLYIILRSWWRGGRTVEWRGRVYVEKREREKNSVSGKRLRS